MIWLNSCLKWSKFPDKKHQKKKGECIHFLALSVCPKQIFFVAYFYGLFGYNHLIFGMEHQLGVLYRAYRFQTCAMSFSVYLFWKLKVEYSESSCSVILCGAWYLTKHVLFSLIIKHVKASENCFPVEVQYRLS